MCSNHTHYSSRYSSNMFSNHVYKYTILRPIRVHIIISESSIICENQRKFNLGKIISIYCFKDKRVRIYIKTRPYVHIRINIIFATKIAKKPKVWKFNNSLSLKLISIKK